tara:strand:+ start:1461 stop:1844 length:384 start_codon:yes stop_codon:yes gene_type:complete
MTIQIDSSLFLPQVKSKFSRRKQTKNIESLSDETIIQAQQYFDDAVWIKDETIKNKKDTRVSMTAYVLGRVDLNDRKKSFFVPTFVWAWIAQQVIGYLVKIIVNYYWMHDPDVMDNNLYNKVLKRIP